ncbi:unnamed protein product [Protopolystoma xenopodis]|uniref:Uncharacterized protein n=1 Tax=Protopolystoma xenopodis TaxID=117903 RepID=A0A3S5A4J7_9PLAT|nr:unnamed protein product [Protopolystoma xenopodis]
MSGVIHLWNVPPITLNEGSSSIETIQALTTAWLLHNQHLPDQTPSEFTVQELQWLCLWTPTLQQPEPHETSKSQKNHSLRCILIAGGEDGMVTIWPISTPFGDQPGGMTRSSRKPGPKYLHGIGYFGQCGGAVIS